ncbi:hybrid sensor histidine kinase/response regulator transcription factor [Flavicella sediminum]|uniref:hybrid sensor histidine kinase/response regulator transcription factor n=1 Tax=Flavicella sediminum TaxID=2585141 RepID=UPI001FB860BF|nr:hybrid sensor histidine kinase/response regulator transcription factor [Flavicella sediminum]
MKQTFTYLVFLIFVHFGYSQDYLGFKHLTTKDGLSQNDVNAIIQDDQGFMWFGTHDGLNRYDGYNFTIFKPNPNDAHSINSNLIWDIINDENGNLWIGTTGQGLNYFDRKTEKFKHFTHIANNPNSLSSNYLSRIYLDKKNRLWVGSISGLDVLDLNSPLDSIKIKHFQTTTETLGEISSIKSVNSIFEDSNGQLWIGTINGIFRLNKNPNGDEFFQNYNAILGFKNRNVKAINEDSFGNLLIGTTNGLYIKRNDNKPVIKLNDFYTGKILTYKNQIWCGTASGLIFYKSTSPKDNPTYIHHFSYNPKSPENSISKNQVNSLYIDRAGIVWAGVIGGGVNKLDLEQKRFRVVRKTNIKNSLANENIKSLFEDSNGNLWIGSHGGGLNIALKGDHDLDHLHNFKRYLKPYDILEINEGSTKKILIGTEGSPGLYEVDITNNPTITENSFKTVNEITPSTFALAQDSQKNIWIGTYNGGVFRWLATETPGEYRKDILSYEPTKQESISSNIIREIVEDSKGTLWFATADGLCSLSKTERTKRNPKFKVYKNTPGDPKTITHNYILTIREAADGTIWIGTFGGGLNKFIPATENEPEHFEVISERNGLPNNVIKAIVEDANKNLWISSNRGLSRINPTNGNIKNYDSNDGLQSDEFGELASLKRKNGEILFGGVNGLNIFNPNTIKDNTTESNTIITKLSIFNKPIAIGEEINGRVLLKNSINDLKEIELKYQENSFSFEFSGLHFAAPKKNQYKYKLEGFNDHWINTSSDMRFATYTNLEPGKYTLKVKSSNNDGLWNKQPTELIIKVTPPFWRSTYAKIIYLLLFIASLFGFQRFTIIKSTKKHQLELEHLEKEKYEEINKLKLEFFTNISHEFRTPLTLIKGPLDFLQKQGPKISHKKASEQYALMSKNIDSLLRLVNQLLDFRKMDKGKMSLSVGEHDMIKFVKEICEPFQFLSMSKKINFNIKHTDKSYLSWFDPNALEKIINNLLSNAFKFTPEKGSINIHICKGENFDIPTGLQKVSNKENYMVIQVTDTGSGIPAHRIKFIFERFYVDRDVRKVNTQGAGIGLAFIKDLVELHQGSIDVTSDAKTGTTFLVWLPIEKENYENIKDISFTEPSEDANFTNQIDAELNAIDVIDDILDQNISKTRSKLPIVLVVDDNAEIRSVIKNGISENYDVYEAENGERGFEFAKKLMPNIVITDVLMPIMDGIEFCNKLKTSKETSHIPVIMLTAKTSQEWEIQGLKTGADAYIRKPFDLELLELKLTNTLKTREELRKRFNREITLQPEEITVTSTDEKFLQNAIQIVEKHMMNTEFSVEMLVKEMALSRSNLHFKIKELTGLSSSEFIRNIRLKRAVQLLESSDLSVKEIMYMTGFNTASYFSKCFKKQFGIIPSKYVRNVSKKNNPPEEETPLT